MPNHRVESPASIITVHGSKKTLPAGIVIKSSSKSKGTNSSASRAAPRESSVDSDADDSRSMSKSSKSKQRKDAQRSAKDPETLFSDDDPERGSTPSSSTLRTLSSRAPSQDRTARRRRSKSPAHKEDGNDDEVIEISSSGDDGTHEDMFDKICRGLQIWDRGKRNKVPQVLKSMSQDAKALNGPLPPHVNVLLTFIDGFALKASKKKTATVTNAKLMTKTKDELKLIKKCFKILVETIEDLANYIELLAERPGIIRLLATFIDSYARAGRADDVFLFKKNSLSWAWAVPGHAPTLNIKGMDKNARGFRHIQTAYMLTGVSYKTIFERDPQNFCNRAQDMAHDGTSISITHADIPNFLYDQSMISDDPLTGLFLSEPFIKGYTLLEFGENEGGSGGRRGRANHVKIPKMLYVAVLLRFSYSSAVKWTDPLKDGEFLYQEFYERLWKIFKDETNKAWVTATRETLDRRIFGTGSSKNMPIVIDSEDALELARVKTTDERLRERREQFLEAQRQAATEAEMADKTVEPEQQLSKSRADAQPQLPAISSVDSNAGSASDSGPANTLNPDDDFDGALTDLEDYEEPAAPPTPPVVVPQKRSAASSSGGAEKKQKKSKKSKKD